MDTNNIRTNLDQLPNLHWCTDSSGKRRLDATVLPVGERLATCQTPNEIAEFATTFGLRWEDLAARAAAAPNFGQFRMVVGNLLRGIEDRVARGAAPKDAAYPAEAKARARAAEKAAKAAARTEAEQAKTAAKAAAKAARDAAKATAEAEKAAAKASKAA